MNAAYATFVASSAALGGFLFGFDSAVINGAVRGIQATFRSSSASPASPSHRPARDAGARRSGFRVDGAVDRLGRLGAGHQPGQRRHQQLLWGAMGMVLTLALLAAAWVTAQADAAGQLRLASPHGEDM